MMLRDSKYASSASEPQMHSAGGIQVFKQHHLPSFSRVTEKADEEDQGDDEDEDEDIEDGDDEDDNVTSLNQKWSNM